MRVPKYLEIWHQRFLLCYEPSQRWVKLLKSNSSYQHSAPLRFRSSVAQGVSTVFSQSWINSHLLEENAHVQHCIPLGKEIRGQESSQNYGNPCNKNTIITSTGFPTTARERDGVNDPNELDVLAVATHAASEYGKYQWPCPRTVEWLEWVASSYLSLMRIIL